MKIQKNKDWLSEWKKHFKRFKYCGFDFIPSWKKGSPGPRSILVEPGMAFGTGTHPTTQFAIRGLVDFKLNVKGRSILDVGTGSGILSVVAEKLGAKTISAVDNDPESWRVAKEMFKLNQCKRARIDKKQLAELVETHDVVLANIIDGVLLDISKLLIKRTKKGGLIILSGILTERSEGFVEKFSKKSSKKSNVELLKEYTDNEWTAFVLRKL